MTLQNRFHPYLWTVVENRLLEKRLGRLLTHLDNEEILQDTYVNAWRAANRLKANTTQKEFQGWLAAIANNECNSRLRRHAVRERIAEVIPLGDVTIRTTGIPGNIAEQVATRDVFQRAWQQLTDRYREWLTYELTGVPLEERVSITGMKEHTVQNETAKALKQWRRLIQEEEDRVSSHVLTPEAFAFERLGKYEQRLIRYEQGDLPLEEREQLAGMSERIRQTETAKAKFRFRQLLLEARERQNGYKAPPEERAWERLSDADQRWLTLYREGRYANGYDALAEELGQKRNTVKNGYLVAQRKYDAYLKEEQASNGRLSVSA